MKKLLLILAFVLTPINAFAQCNGVFQPNFICGRLTTPGPPGPVPNSALTGVPGGSNGQIQYNNSGAFGGFTPGGDLSFSVPNFTIGPNAVTTSKINNGAVTNPKLAVGPVNTYKGSLDGVNTSDIPFTTTPGVIPTTSTVTISIASPGVITWPSHGLTANTVIYFCTTGALPTGLTACIPGTGGTMEPNAYQSDPQLYYVVGSSITTNTFQVSLTPGGAAINTSGTQSGTQTAFANAMACAGCIGEHKYIIVPVTGTGSVACNNGSPDTLFASLSLTPGNWKIWGSAGVFGSGGAVFNTSHASYGLGITGICSTPYCGTTDWHLTTNNSNGVLFPFNTSEIPVYTNSTLNAYQEPVWATGTATCFGSLHAVRDR